MKFTKIKNKHNMRPVERYEAESIEKKVKRIINENEPIEDGAPIIYQERADGVKPEFNIRTDRWEIAIEAMDKVTKEELSKYTKSQGKPNEGIELKKDEIATVQPKTEGEAKAPEGN
uniref:Uncharacterized protein n=1 Tax=Dulem virus 201 TaxID=3145678 RepID=A0AAU8B747_9VIRU